MADNPNQLDRKKTDSQLDPVAMEMRLKIDQAKKAINKLNQTQAQTKKLNIKENRLILNSKKKNSKKSEGRKENRSDNYQRQPFQESDPEEIERTLNLQKDSRLNDQAENNEKDPSLSSGEERNNSENYNLGASPDIISDDQSQAQSLRENRLESLKKGEIGDNSISNSKSEETSSIDLDPASQENNLEKQKAQSNIPKIPGIGSLTGGIDPNDSPEEIIKKQAKQKTKMAILTWILALILAASPYIIAGIIIVILLFPTAMAYYCASQMGWTQKISFGWSVLWRDYDSLLKKATSNTCFPDIDTTKIPNDEPKSTTKSSPASSVATEAENVNPAVPIE